MKKILLFGLLLIAFGLTGCEYNSLEEEELVDELVLIPKESANQKAKSASNHKPTPYSCLISTLADDEADFNYWNQSFWVYFPKPAVDQAEGKTVFKAFSFSSKHAGEKAGSWAGKDNIVRVAQCVIPDTDLAETLLENQLRKFGRGTWLKSRKTTIDATPKKGFNAKSASGDWECGEWYTLFVCKMEEDENGNSYVVADECTEVGPFCAYYVYVEGNDPGGGGGGGGDNGFPGDDPGECDPMGTEPCFDDGGGGSIPPPEPDPCEEDNPPAYCENPCETGDPILDDEVIQLAFENMWEDSNYGSDSSPNPESQRKEQVGFIVPNGFGGYQLQRLSSSFITAQTPCEVRFKAPTNLPDGTILIHTHPYSKGEPQNHCIPGITLEYDNKPGKEDRPTLNTLGLDHGIILDANKVIRFTPNESEQATLVNRCGY